MHCIGGRCGARRTPSAQNFLRGATAVAAQRDLGIQIRAGLHTGEVELDGPDVRGIAV